MRRLFSQRYSPRIKPQFQSGSMDHCEPPVDLNIVRQVRHDNVRRTLSEFGYAGLLIFDQINIKYATDSQNQSLWCDRNEVRSCLILNEGPCILFDYCEIPGIKEGLPLINEIRSMSPFTYGYYGKNAFRNEDKWISQLESLFQQYGGGNREIAIDKLDPSIVSKLIDKGFIIRNGFEVMEDSKVIKSPQEIELMKYAIDKVQNGIQRMRDELKPGVTENDLWGYLNLVNAQSGGERVETKLLTSGYRTNPWYQECSMKVIENGEMVAFDTDTIGPFGMCVDLSRSWVCGDKPNDWQRKLYQEAYNQLQRNIEIIKPGKSTIELGLQLRKSPPEFQGQQYTVGAHGVGMSDEYPNIQYDPNPLLAPDIEVRPGMTFSVEALVGKEGFGECVKLEEQILVTEDGIERLSNYPYELEWL